MKTSMIKVISLLGAASALALSVGCVAPNDSTDLDEEDDIALEDGDEDVAETDDALCGEVLVDCGCPCGYGGYGWGFGHGYGFGGYGYGGAVGYGYGAVGGVGYGGIGYGGIGYGGVGYGGIGYGGVGYGGVGYGGVGCGGCGDVVVAAGCGC